LGVGRGSAFRVPNEVSRPIVFCGAIISGPGCTFIDDGTDRYLIEGEFPEGSRVRVTGILSGSRIKPEQIEPAGMDADGILTRIRGFRERLAR
jgi:replication factor A1